MNKDKEIASDFQIDEKEYAESLLKHFLEAFSLIKDANKNEVENILLNSISDSREKADLQELFDEEKDFSKNLNDLRKSQKDPTDWLEEKIVDRIRTVIPEIEENEMQEILDALPKAMDDHLVETTDLVEEEAKLVKNIIRKNTK